MSSLNKVMLIGNLGNDPDIRSMQNGGRVANLSIATSESWKDKNTGEKREKTEWHRVVVFNDGLIKVIESYVKKGSKIYIEGQLETRKWQDQSGADRYTTEVVVKFGGNLVLLGGQGNQSQNQGGQEQYQRDAYQAQQQSQHDQAKANGYQQDDFEDDIPF